MSIREANSGRVLQSGNTSGERQKYNLTQQITNQFSSSPSYFEVYFNNSVSKTGVHIVESSAKEKVDNAKTVIMKPSDTINMGDLVNWNSEYWLCTSGELFNDIYEKGKITKCNNILKFYDKNSSLREVPCIINGGSIRLEENKFLNLPDNQFLIIIPNNADTADIKMDNRFIIGGKAYKVITDTDNISKIGLLEFKVETTSPIEDDNLTLGIANYYSNQAIYSVSILNGENANMYFASSTLQLEVVAKKNGVVVTNPELTFESNNTNIATVSATGLITAIGTGDVIISVEYESSGDTINIHSDISVTDDYDIVISPSDTTIKVTKSITFTATPMKNGVEDTLKIVDWSVKNVDGSLNNYVTITPNDKTCVLTCGSIANKYIILRAELQFDNSYYEEVQIKTINLF